MTTLQKVIKYLAIAFALFLTASIISGILGAVGLFGGLFDSNAVTGETKTYAVSPGITSIDIEISAADLTVRNADTFYIESNLKNLRVTEENGTLIIQESTKFATYTDAVLALYIPDRMLFEKAEITTGAGRLNIDRLSAASLRLELGAGEVTIGSLNVGSKTEIEGGAGKITISGGSLRNLDLEMGVGQLNLTSFLTGSSELDLGVGQSNITLIGSEADYALELEKGIGSVTVNGKDVTDFGSSGNGENRIDISGGIGAINIDFKAAA